MAKTVVSFSSYAKDEEMFETCVTAMERGLLHVNATNSYGWTLGKVFLEYHSWTSSFKKCLGQVLGVASRRVFALESCALPVRVLFAHKTSFVQHPGTMGRLGFGAAQ